ncbi:MAG: hypothetical protein QF723_09290, partial [Phycisphaerales bacterium]|nr:hypothetical protein [Phycisphaerales bacterium]
MNGAASPPRWTGTWSILLLAMACVVLVVGLVFTNEQWGVAMTFAGGGAAALCLIGLLLSQPAIAFVGTLICVCGGMVAAPRHPATRLPGHPAPGHLESMPGVAPS